MWNTSFSEVVIIYKYISPLESFIIPQFNSPTHWPDCSLHITTQHLHPQTGQRLECQSPFACYSGHFTGVVFLSPVWLVCLFCMMSSRKVNHEPWITYLQSSYGSPLSYFASLARLNYVKVSPSVLRAAERHSVTRHPAQCTSLCQSFYGLWLEFITSLRDSDYKTLVTMLTKAHVISAVVFKHSGVCGFYMASYCAPLVLCDCPSLKCEKMW